MDRLKEAVIDIGDTIGGIILGLSLDAHSNFMLMLGIILISASTYLKYFKTRSKSTGGQKYTVEEIVEHLKNI